VINAATSTVQTVVDAISGPIKTGRTTRTIDTVRTIGGPIQAIIHTVTTPVGSILDTIPFAIQFALYAVSYICVDWAHGQ